MDCTDVSLFSVYKAFDSLEHHLLFKSLSVFGFENKFINMVRILYNDIHFSVLVNLQTMKHFNCDRGVHQGCLVSPFPSLFFPVSFIKV